MNRATFIKSLLIAPFVALGAVKLSNVIIPNKTHKYGLVSVEKLPPKTRSGDWRVKVNGRLDHDLSIYAAHDIEGWYLYHEPQEDRTIPRKLIKAYADIEFIYQPFI